MIFINMGNIGKAKTKLKELKLRTEKDLYGLRYESQEITSLNENVLKQVKFICETNDLVCPLYESNGEIKFNKKSNGFYNVLNFLASEYSIVFNLE